MYALKRRENGWLGSHLRWSEEGRQLVASAGIEPDEGCPF
jgi:hypothetical protein